LAGAVAAHTTHPVIGVPIVSGSLQGMDALLSTAMMPPGIPVATVAIGGAGERGPVGAQIIALGDPALAKAVTANARRGCKRCWSRRPKCARSGRRRRSSSRDYSAGGRRLSDRTFYGLAVDALNESALSKLRALKGREAEKAFSLLYPRARNAGLFASEFATPNA